MHFSRRRLRIINIMEMLVGVSRILKPYRWHLSTYQILVLGFAGLMGAGYLAANIGSGWHPPRSGRTV